MRATASALSLLLAAASLAGCASAAASSSPSPSSFDAPYAASAAASYESSWSTAPALAFAAPPAQDAADTEFDRGGLYIGLYGIKSFEDIDAGGGVDTSDSDIGVGLKLGFRLGRFLAVEAAAENVEGFEIDSGNVESDLDLTQYGVQAKFFLLGGRFQPYGLAGFGVTSADVDDFSLDHDGGYIRIGIGMDVYITSNFAAFGELNHNEGTGSTDDISHTDLALGVLFRF